MGGKSTTTNTPAPLSAEEIANQRQQLELGNLQLKQFQEQMEFQAKAYTAIEPLLAAQTQLYEQELAQGQTPQAQEIRQLQDSLTLEQLQRAQRLGPLEEELVNAQIEQIRSGGAATPEQQALIEQYKEAAYASGSSDIGASREENLRRLRDFASSAGLRPGDSPIIDRGQLLATEAVRQQARLGSELEAGAAQAKLNFPLGVEQIYGASNRAQQALIQSAQDFQGRLRDQAFQNRIALASSAGGTAGQFGQLGLGLAGVGPQFRFGAQGSTQVTKESPGIGQILQGVGGGLAALGMFSSRAVKDKTGDIDPGQALAAFRDMAIDRWLYKKHAVAADDAHREHIGPYAEDFNAAFGLKDDGKIDIVSLLGALAAAVKGAALRLDRLEASHG